MSVEFHDYSMQVIEAMNAHVDAALEEVAGEIESQTKRNSRVKTGQTKNSFRHHVDTDTHTAYIGSNHENAIWEELGTGEYALNGNGRQGGWRYVDEQGNGHFTYGKRPSRALFNAYTRLRNWAISHIQRSIRGL